jgi:hypothetical protein
LLLLLLLLLLASPAPFERRSAATAVARRCLPHCGRRRAGVD